MKQQFLSKQILLNCSTAFAFASVGRDISPPSRSKECAPSVAPFIDWLRLPEPSGTTPLSLQLYGTWLTWYHEVATDVVPALQICS